MFDENFDIFDDTTVLPVEKNNDINFEPKKTYITDCFITDRTKHESAVPIDAEYTKMQMLQKFPYKTFPFELDTFQKLALTGLHLNHSVLVSAHTSSGKTVIAEYAISMSLTNKQRVIYTSPIKALSNQKYRELQEEYQDVGLVTGDVTLNPNASCLVMTTEILRNMLYRGSEIMREVKWIIFDEIHYIKEKERGVVWEECIIMSPKDVRMVFLSATVPNADEFAEWVSEITGAIVHVVYTEKRPTPLEHFLAQKGGQMTKILYEKPRDTRSEENNKNDISKKTKSSQDGAGGRDTADKDKKVKKKKNKKNKNKYNESGDVNGTMHEDTLTSSNKLKMSKLENEDEDTLTSSNKLKMSKLENEDTLTSSDKLKMSKLENEDTPFSSKKLKKHKCDDANGTENEDTPAKSKKKRSKKNKVKHDAVDEPVETKADGDKRFDNDTVLHKLTTSYFDKKAFQLCMKRINGRQRIEDEDVKAVLQNLIEQRCLPVIVFSFSRKECEKYALSLTEDFLTEQEKETINLIFSNALLNLREEDRNLPLISNMLPMLLKGIGIHHSGLLPILKEIVEILFQEGLLKILFATETFSIGLNMPARSVVFTNLTKFDGEERRLLSSGEYIQMSGRAGRRGIDTKGMVIAMISEAINIKKAEVLFSGLADKLVSAFRLSYNMILNLMRVEGLDTLFLLERSFFHYQSKRGREEMNKKVLKMKVMVDSIKMKRQGTKESLKKNAKALRYGNALNRDELAELHEMDENLKLHKQDTPHEVDLESEELCTVNEANEHYIFDENVLNIHKNNLNPILLLNNVNLSFDIQKMTPLQIYNVLLAYEKIRVKRNQILSGYTKKYLEKGRIINLFVPRKGSPFFIFNAMVKEVSINEISIVTKINRNLVIKKFKIEYVDKIYDVRLKNLIGLEMVKNKMKSITLKEMEMKKEEYEICEYLNEFLYDLEEKLDKIKANVCFYCGNCMDNTDCLNLRCFEENELEEYIENKALSTELSAAAVLEADEFNLRNVFLEEMYLKLYDNNLLRLKELNQIYHMDECKKMIQVLRRLEYCNENNVLTKGRVACEISTGDELLLTEMMFNGDFIALPVEEVVPLLSCIIYPEWDNESSISETNQKNYNLLKSMVEKICLVMRNCGIEVETNCMLKRYSYELMDVVELWVRGYSFTEICNRTNAFEGTIIRCFRRLEELLKQMCGAARNIGNSDLENLFAMGISKIKRDIVFASSLYL